MGALPVGSCLRLGLKRPHLSRRVMAPTVPHEPCAFQHGPVDLGTESGMMPLQENKLAAKHKMVYEVVCTYEVEAVSKAAAGRIASRVAQTLSRTGVTRSSGADGTATLLKTTARFKRKSSRR